MDMDAIFSRNDASNPAAQAAARAGSLEPAPLLDRFRAIRSTTLLLARELSAEDQCVKTMPDGGPPKWHLAHTTWFF